MQAFTQMKANKICTDLYCTIKVTDLTYKCHQPKESS